MQRPRLILRTVAGLAVIGVCRLLVLQSILRFGQEFIAAILPTAIPDFVFAFIVDSLTVVVTFGPGVVLAVLMAIRLNRPPKGDTCRCRECGYTLRGLSEPRCPECGEMI